MSDNMNEGREQHFMDIDRMVNEGLGGGQVTMDNGFIGDTTTDTMDETDSTSAPSFGKEQVCLDVNRVKEIIRSDRHIPVFYGKSPVYLERVNESDGTVTVFNLDSQQRHTVQAKQLHEGE